MISGEQQSELTALAERWAMMPSLGQSCLICRMCGLGCNMARNSIEEHDPHIFSNYHPLGPYQQFMVINYNPGWEEIRAKEPLAGGAGENFDKALRRTMWERRDFYITNIIKCFSPRNIPPTDAQIRCCEPFLRMELAVVKPVLVIALGNAVLKNLCPGADFDGSVGRIINSDRFGVKVYAVRHPSPLDLTTKLRIDQFRRHIELLGQLMNRILLPW